MTKGSVVSSSISSARVAPGLLARRLVRLTASLAVAWLLAGTMARAQQAAEPAELAQARQLFDALDYEQALPLLDRAVAVLEQQAARDPNSRQMLTAAYGMRARARFGTGNKDGAVADFRSALSIDPGFALGQGVSPRIVALLDEVKSSTIGALEILTDPGDVNVLVDGAPARVDAGKVSLAAGAHAIKITRPGYKSADQSVVVSAGQSVPLRLTLERVSTVLTVISSPPGVEVVVNGTSRGKTAGGPLSPSLATLPQQLGVPPDQVSQPLAIGDLSTGTLDVELRRPCYATEHRQLPVQGLSDVMLDPVKMKPAVGTLSIDSDPAGATVLVDGEDKGSAPVTLSSVCAGSHTVEFRSVAGRDVQRISLDSGAQVSVAGRMRAAFAILAAPQAANGPDVRLGVERAFASSRSLLLYAPAAEASRAAIEKETVNDEWFGLLPGQMGLPAGDRRGKLQRLADAFDAQGIAWVRPTTPGSNEVTVALEVPGGASPDDLVVDLDRPDSVRQAVSRLDQPLTLSHATLGIASVDVLDVKGAVIVDVEAGKPGAAAGLKVGQIIESLDGQAVTSVTDFETRLGTHQATDRVTLSVRAPGGAPQTVTAGLQVVPVLVAGTDRFMPANAVVAVLRSRLAGVSDPAELAATQLNLGAALLRAGDGAGAKEILDKTTLPAGSGVSAGTVAFLRGQASELAGDRAAAITAYTTASQADGRLPADGPLVKSLAARALERLK
jgi:archaellum component FlaG (FlaF/FlaG flagellin family)